MDLIIWRIVRLSGDGIAKEDWIEDKRVVSKCCRTSEEEEPVMKAYACKGSRG